MITRRGFLQGILAAGVAPYVATLSGVLMPVRVTMPDTAFTAFQRQYRQEFIAGFEQHQSLLREAGHHRWFDLTVEDEDLEAKRWLQEKTEVQRRAMCEAVIKDKRG